MVVLNKEQKASHASASLKPRLDLYWTLIKMHIRNKIYPSACWDFRSVMAGQLYQSRAGIVRLTTVADNQRNHSVCLKQISSGLKYWIHWMHVYAFIHIIFMHINTNIKRSYVYEWIHVHFYAQANTHMICPTSSVCIHTILHMRIKIIRLALQKGRKSNQN